MDGIQRRQYEMLLRVRDFGNTHRHLFPEASVAAQTFAAVSATIDDLTATDLMKMSASLSARADRKAAARKALTDLLVKVTQLGKVLRARGRTTPVFELPASRSDQTLLTSARQFAQDAAPLAADFAAHGMPAPKIAETAAAFEAVMRDRGMSRSDHTAARTRIRELLSTALVEARRLDLIVDNELAADKVIQAVWKQARRVEDPRGPRGASPADPMAPAFEPPAPAMPSDGVASGPPAGI
jgi:hypothetical protein